MSLRYFDKLVIQLIYVTAEDDQKGIVIPVL